MLPMTLLTVQSRSHIVDVLWTNGTPGASDVRRSWPRSGVRPSERTNTLTSRRKRLRCGLTKSLTKSRKWSWSKSTPLLTERGCINVKMFNGPLWSLSVGAGRVKMQSSGTTFYHCIEHTFLSHLESLLLRGRNIRVRRCQGITKSGHIAE